MSSAALLSFLFLVFATVVAGDAVAQLSQRGHQVEGWVAWGNGRRYWGGGSWYGGNGGWYNGNAGRYYQGWHPGYYPGYSGGGASTGWVEVGWGDQGRFL
eukprot:jgi/Botrbrau1/9991/Bobra.0012s0080.1